MRLALFALIGSLSLLSSCCGMDGGMKGNPYTGPWTARGLLTYPVVGTGANGGTGTGSVAVDVTVTTAPSHCFPSSFAVAIGGIGCSLAGSISNPPGAFSIAPGQSCTISTSTGPITLDVEGGSVGQEGNVTSVAITTTAGPVEFQGTS